LRGGSYGSTRKVRVAQTGPASISSIADSAVTPHSVAPSVIAQSNEDGPRSPTGPGWMMIVWVCRQTSAGTRSLRNGHSTRSGRLTATASRTAASESDVWTTTW
jgi:hypothetical protein